MSEDAFTVVQYGVGPIGERLVRAARGRNAAFVGAVDIDPEKVGTDLGRQCGLDERLGVAITDDVEEALSESPDVVFHSTVSAAAAAEDQLAELLESGCNVVTTCEELVYPWRDHAETARRLDTIAHNAGVTCLGTGINPGFAMDLLPAALSAPMERIEAVEVERVQDAGDRREPLQRKVGAGLDADRFEDEIAAGGGHVGAAESVAMLASALEWELDTIETSIDPVLADERLETEYLTVDVGDVAGVHQTARGIEAGTERVRLELKMAVGLEARDVVRFEATPEVSVTVDGGYHGDVSTAAIVANCAPHVVEADPGLKTMLDVPVCSAVRQY